MAFRFLFLSFVFASLASAATAPSPLLAVTSHRGDNVYLYTLVGTPVGGKTTAEHLIGTSRAKPFSGLRGMLNVGAGRVLIANSQSANSLVVSYGNFCLSDATIPNHDGNVSTVGSSLFDHPYDIAETPSGNGYLVTNQNLNTVVRVDPELNVSVVITAAGSPRGLAFDATGHLWVAIDTTNTVNVYDSTSYALVKQFTMPGPIGVRFDAVNRWILITNNDKAKSKVFAYDPVSMTIVKEITNPNFDHGAGLAVHNGQWFVLSRNTHTLFSLDLVAGTMTSLNASLETDPEQISVLSC